ncbi:MULTISPECIES: hypothetical protein [Acidithrix]|uniref:Plasmid stabilization system protein n=1 Tax=Acidithrix ferrooxidans TaxID=1280514 RepID=A0A0D8HKP5_9ACTN|nr:MULTISPECIES: hypothetical protein [Acidithrix]KJF18503.1 hypothetical protein AXFE_06310 [Acidithrix ferrooxidans]CAG4906968.1 unnamed protein product [Acidithrix sp. C25]
MSERKRTYSSPGAFCRALTDKLKTDPRGSNFEPLKAFLGSGDYALATTELYAIDDDQLIVLVVEIGIRSEVYRNF